MSLKNRYFVVLMFIYLFNNAKAENFELWNTSQASINVRVWTMSKAIGPNTQIDWQINSEKPDRAVIVGPNKFNQTTLKYKVNEGLLIMLQPNGAQNTSDYVITFDSHKLPSQIFLKWDGKKLIKQEATLTKKRTGGGLSIDEKTEYTMETRLELLKRLK